MINMGCVNLRINTAFFAYLLLLQLPLKCANPVRPSSPAESKNHGPPKVGPNLVLIHNFSHNETKLRQDYQNTLNGNKTQDQIAITNEPVMTTSKEMPLLLPGGIFGDDFVNPPPQLPATQQPSPSVASSDSTVELPLFYPALPEQPKYRPTSYGTIRDTFNPHPGHGNSPRQSSGSASFKHSIFGFPVISNTRENVGHQISW